MLLGENIAASTVTIILKPIIYIIIYYIILWGGHCAIVYTFVTFCFPLSWCNPVTQCYSVTPRHRAPLYTIRVMVYTCVMVHLRVLAHHRVMYFTSRCMRYMAIFLKHNYCEGFHSILRIIVYSANNFIAVTWFSKILKYLDASCPFRGVAIQRSDNSEGWQFRWMGILLLSK